MYKRDNFKMAVSGLLTHKSRSFLTILGIVIGISSIIIVMSIGKSAQNLIVSQIQSLGPNNVFILPGGQPKGPTSFGTSIINDSLKEKDISDLAKKSNVPDATSVIPLVFGPVTISYSSEVYDTLVLGGPQEILDIYHLNVTEGNFFTKDDILQKSEIVVIGKTIKEKLFGNNLTIGEKIKIKNKNFRIIGVLEAKGQSPFINFDEAVITPYSTAQQYILGIKYFQRVIIEAVSTDKIPNIINDIKTLLRDNHNITDPDKDDFNVQTQGDLVKTISSITDILTIFLGAIAAISLVVGGIGIMNIMLVSVTERTKEIGLLKALGATNSNILTQFLTEAVILTLSGGIFGIIFGTLTSLLVTLIVNKFFGAGFTFFFSITGALLGVCVSSLIGFIFGIYPAKQAAQKNPIETLRYE